MRKLIFGTHLLCLALAAPLFGQSGVLLDFNSKAVTSISGDGAKELTPARAQQAAQSESGRSTSDHQIGLGLFQPYTARTTGSWPEAVVFVPAAADDTWGLYE